jgi:hypothetical protein
MNGGEIIVNNVFALLKMNKQKIKTTQFLMAFFCVTMLHKNH